MFNIYFTLASFEKLHLLLSIHEDIRELSRIESRLSNEKSLKAKKKHQKEIYKMDAKIKKSIEQYHKQQKERDKQKVIHAYVMFRSFEGKQRALYAFRKRRCCLCFYGESYKKFMGKTLKVKSAISPDLILWENLRVSKMYRCWRTFIIAIVSFIIIVASLVLIIAGRYFQNEAQNIMPTT